MYESKSFKLVRKGGLEPPRFYPPDPKSGASANSATFARLESTTSLSGPFHCSGNCSGLLTIFVQFLDCSGYCLSYRMNVPLVTLACPAISRIVNASAPDAPRSVKAVCRVECRTASQGSPSSSRRALNCPETVYREIGALKQSSFAT